MDRKKRNAIILAAAAAVVLILAAAVIWASAGGGSAPASSNPRENQDGEVVADMPQQEEKPTAEPAVLNVDFAVRSDPPLIKKIAQYNSGIAPLVHYERDAHLLRAVDSQAFRIDLGLGAGLNIDFLARDVVTGTPDRLEYNFEPLERLAEILHEQHNVPYYSWAYVPLPFQEDDDFRRLNTEIPDWTRKWQEMHRTFSSHFREKGIRIGYHEVYNEPDLSEVFFQEPFETYLDVYRYGARGLREGDPDVMIGGPALASGESVANVMSFLEMVDQEDLPLDFFSFHAYWENGSFWNKLENIRNIMTWYEGFETTEIHLNELNYVGGPQGANSLNNKYAIAPKMFDLISETLKAPDITMVNWAQFMESTAGDDAYGIIHRNGRKKAAYNVFKIYADLPEERVVADWGDDWEAGQEIGVLASANAHKAGVVLWNRTVEDRDVSVHLNNLPFGQGNVRLYRIDGEHASYFDGASEDLEVVEQQTDADLSGHVWTGVIPAEGVVYLTVDDGSAPEDFHPEAYHHYTASDIRTHYYFEDRKKDNYAWFDRKRWRFYLGMGSQEQARSLAGVTAEALPDRLDVRFAVSGDPKALSDRSALYMRIDYHTPEGYAKSVVFHGGLYEGSGDETYPFGTGRKADEIVTVEELAQFAVEPARHAPPEWDGRVLISAGMADAGPGARAEITIR